MSFYLYMSEIANLRRGFILRILSEGDLNQRLYDTYFCSMILLWFERAGGLTRLWLQRARGTGIHWSGRLLQFTSTVKLAHPIHYAECWFRVSVRCRSTQSSVAACCRGVARDPGWPLEASFLQRWPVNRQLVCYFFSAMEWPVWPIRCPSLCSVSTRFSSIIWPYVVTHTL